MWSLGVMPFELLTDQPDLRMHEGKDKACIRCNIVACVSSVSSGPCSHFFCI